LVSARSHEAVCADNRRLSARVRPVEGESAAAAPVHDPERLLQTKRPARRPAV